MADATRVLREVQLDTDGGLVPARGSVPLYSMRLSKFVKDDSAAVGATKADRKMAVARDKDVGSFVGEIGATKADRKMAVARNKDVGNFIGEIGATKADRKMAVARNKDVGSFIGEIGVTNAEPANKMAAGTGMMKAASWSDFGTKPAAGNKTALGSEPGPKEERKTAMITKETVPESFIDRIKTHPSRKLPPLTQDDIEFYTENSPNYPKFLASELANITRWNYFVDLEQDCLRQHKEKGYAEVGVDFTNGIKQIFILPQD